MAKSQFDYDPADEINEKQAEIERLMDQLEQAKKQHEETMLSVIKMTEAQAEMELAMNELVKQLPENSARLVEQAEASIRECAEVKGRIQLAAKKLRAGNLYDEATKAALAILEAP